MVLLRRIASYSLQSFRVRMVHQVQTQFSHVSNESFR
jgi:hypothetical protein